MSNFSDDIKTKELWQRTLGLLPTNFLPTSVQQFVMQNGQINNFCIDFENNFKAEEYKHYSWATDTNCFINIDEKNLNLFRWDTPEITIFNLNKLNEQGLEKIYKYIGSFTQPKEISVVPFIIEIFNKLRNASGESDGLRALQSLLYLIAKSDNNEVDNTKWGLNENIQNNLPKHFENIFEDFKSRVNLEKDTTKLILRHTSGKLFQEAHYQATLSGQLDIYGIPTASKNSKNKSNNNETIGVHFTPAFITRSIVEESLKNFDFTNLTKIDILDPACGSGEFLKEALRQITEKYSSYAGKINLFGWDKSKTAIEVANFSLNFEKSQYSERDIKVEILQKDSLEYTWGKFDIILMNPPFVSWELLGKDSQEKVVSSLENFSTNRPNLSSPFFYKSLKSLKKDGILGCVLPSSIFNADSYRILREYANENFSVSLIAKLGNLNLFYNAVVDAGIYIAKNNRDSLDDATILWADNTLNSTTDALRRLRVFSLNTSIPVSESNYSIYKAIYSSNDFPNIVSYHSYKLKKRIEELLITKKVTLVKNMFDVKQGARTGANDTFIIDVSFYESLNEKEKKYFKQATTNRSIRNGLLSITNFLWYPYGKYKIKSEEELQKNAPRFYSNFLRESEKKLKARPEVVKGLYNWWELNREGKWQNDEAKLVSTEFGKAGYFAVDYEGKYVVERGHAWILKSNLFKNVDKNEDYPTFDSYEINYGYLALFCSDSFNELLALYSKQIAGGQYYLASKFVNDIPIPDLTREENFGIANELIAFGKKISNASLSEDERKLLNRIVEAVYKV